MLVSKLNIQFNNVSLQLITPENLRKDKIKLYNKKTLSQLGGEISAVYIIYIISFY